MTSDQLDLLDWIDGDRRRCRTRDVRLKIEKEVGLMKVYRIYL
jgi:hypothetical protein